MPYGGKGPVLLLHFLGPQVYDKMVLVSKRRMKSPEDFDYKVCITEGSGTDICHGSYLLHPSASGFQPHCVGARAGEVVIVHAA